MPHSFRLLGHGFDTIQLTLQVRVSEALSEAIYEAQKAAKESRKPEPVTLGPGNVRADVLRHGGMGGDAMLSTGELGEICAFKLDQKRDDWGTMMKIRALALLCYGLPGALDRMWERVEGMGLRPTGYSLGRIDYRFDILTDAGFALSEPCLIRPNRTLVRPYEAVDRKHPVFEWNDDPEVRRLLRGTRIETLMVGKIGTGTQVVIYDKRAEMIVTRNFALMERYGLDPKDKSWRLWRIEVRYAGDVLKRRWNVRDFPTLARELQNMLGRALTRVRYVEAEQEHIPSPRRTVHAFWTTATDAIPLATCEQPPQFAPERAEYMLRDERKRSLDANIAGCAVARAAMDLSDPRKLRELAPNLAHRIVQDALRDGTNRAERALARTWQHAPNNGRS